MRNTRVFIDEKLKFHQHITNAVDMLVIEGAIFTCLDKITVPRYFTTMDMPHLEYVV